MIYQVIDEVWVQNRYRQRRRMTGKKLALDQETGFMRSCTSNGFTPRKKIQFLNRFKVCSNFTKIAESIFVHPQTVYDHLALDPKFREEYNKLAQIEGRPMKLNNAIIEVGKEEKRQFVSSLLQNAKKYL